MKCNHARKMSWEADGFDYVGCCDCGAIITRTDQAPAAPAPEAQHGAEKHGANKKSAERVRQPVVTDRGQRILDMRQRGISYQDIAKSLGCLVSTVKALEKLSLDALAKIAEPWNHLTDGEEKFVKLKASGKSTAEIAKKMKLRPSSVRMMKTVLMRKGVKF